MDNRKYSFSNQSKGLICVIISTTMYGLMPAISQLGYDAGLNPFSTLFGRNAAGLILYALLILFKKAFCKINKKQFAIMMVMSVLGIANGIMAYTSYNYLSAGIASLMAMMYIIFIVMIEAALRISPISPIKAGVLITSFIGIVIIMYNPGETAEASAVGVALGLGAALVYSLQVIIFNSKPMKTVPMELIFFIETVPMVSVIPLVGAGMGFEPFPEDGTQWIFCITLAVFNSVIAMAAFYKAVRLIGAGNAAIIGTAEPIVSCVAGMMLLGDVLTHRTVAGSIIIILSIFVLKLYEKHSGYYDNSTVDES